VVLKTEIRKKGEDLAKAQKEHERDVSRAKIAANNVAKPKDLENLEKEAADTMVMIYSSVLERHISNVPWQRLLLCSSCKQGIRSMIITKCMHSASISDLIIFCSLSFLQRSVRIA
jgi:hypothetical protein